MRIWNQGKRSFFARPIGPISPLGLVGPLDPLGPHGQFGPYTNLALWAMLTHCSSRERILLKWRINSTAATLHNIHTWGWSKIQEKPTQPFLCHLSEEYLEGCRWQSSKGPLHWPLLNRYYGGGDGKKRSQPKNWFGK